jgi:hypothetical protein
MKLILGMHALLLLQEYALFVESFRKQGDVTYILKPTRCDQKQWDCMSCQRTLCRPVVAGRRN